jgi:hypothetical protein
MQCRYVLRLLYSKASIFSWLNSLAPSNSRGMSTGRWGGYKMVWCRRLPWLQDDPTPVRNGDALRIILEQGHPRRCEFRIRECLVSLPQQDEDLAFKAMSHTKRSVFKVRGIFLRRFNAPDNAEKALRTTDYKCLCVAA